MEVKPAISPLEQLKSISDAQRIMQAVAMLDAILAPDDWEMRYFAYNAHWTAQQAMASMRDGSGDEFFATFSPQGAILKGFAHDSPAAARDPRVVQRQLREQLPANFRGFLSEPAFNLTDTTFCMWRDSNQTAWTRAELNGDTEPLEDGTAQLLWVFDGLPQTYASWAREYFETDVPLHAVSAVYALEPLTELLVHQLNPLVTLRNLKADCTEIGYLIAA